ncbi:MAG TPA: outer membrane protein assembly factor BamA, partial [Rhodobacterales bacterium]|nr:outer membrane protein assembly factor BamA [Rhodobacterales bacterium]
TLDVEFVVVRGPRIVVERIDIEGNTTTLDRVVRNRFTTVEGDPFNPREIRAAAERIRALGYFSNVDVQAREGSNPDNVIVDVNVEERGTGSFSFGGTYALGSGFGVSAGFTETNFLGRGQFLDIKFAGGLDVRDYSITFAEPNLFGRDLRLGFKAFYNETTWQNGLFNTRQGGIEPSLDFPLSETGRFRVSTDFGIATIENYTGNSATMLAEQARGWQYGVGAGLGYSFDSRRTGLESDTFYSASINAGVGGIGSDNRYAQGSFKANITTTAISDSITLSATVEGGAIKTLTGPGTRILDRYMMSPDSVLGFAPQGMGPRDLAAADDDALGGNFYGAARLEAKFPIGLPEEYGITGGVFVNAGSVWGLDASPGVDDAMHLRASGGAAIYWDTPIGPLRFSYAVPFMKEAYDVEQRFGLSVSTGF